VSGQTLTVAEVAQLRGIDRVAAYRWLMRNARSYLRRNGRLVVIDAESYARLTASPLARLDARTTDVESRIAEVERRLNVHAEALRKMHAI